MSYTDVFGSDTLPPSGYAYAAFSLTTNSTFEWPYNAADTSNAIAKIMQITPSAGVVMTFPAANAVSTGEDFLIRNVGAETLTIKDNGGNTIDTIAAGVAKYYYVSDNSTAAGTWGKVTYGAGSSTVSAGDLIGYGIKAITSSLNQSHPVFPSASATVAIDDTYRSKVVACTGGTATVTLPAAVTAGDDFFFFLRNAGTGTVTINPDAAETFDGQTTFQVQPGESLMAVCSGTLWYSVGYGRSTLFQYTQLIKDVSAAGSFTLTATEASNKLLTFTGNPASAVTVIVPNTVSVYYLQSSISTAQTITVKTNAGTGVSLAQSTTTIGLCDGTDVVSAQSTTSNTTVSLTNGSAAAPALNFTSQTNTGFFKYSTAGVGLSSNGVEVAHFDTASGSSIATALTVGGAINKVTLTAPATGSTLTIADGKTATVSNTLTFTGTDSSSVAFGTGGTVLFSGGALGTPSSGTLTNCTGLPAAGVTGTALTAAAIGVSVQAYDADLTTWAGITPGTGVGTALAVNVGTAGAVVVNGGALGTPSSGTLTNTSGLPAGTGLTGQVPLANGGTGASLTDPNADRIMFWDDSAGAVTWLTAGTGLTITDTTIAASGGSATITRSAKTGAYTVVAGDNGTIIDCTSGTFTVDLTAAATLGDGFNVWIINSGTGTITINPNASETLDGLVTSITLKQGAGYRLFCNGANWYSLQTRTAGAAAAGLGGVQLGYGAVCSAVGAIAVGQTSTASGTNASSLGKDASATGVGATAIGTNCSASSDAAFAAGRNSGGSSSVATTGTGAMALGGSYASGTDSFAAAIANNTSSYGAQNTSAIAVGSLNKCDGTYASAFGGSNNVVSGSYSFATGRNHSVTGSYATAFGGYGSVSVTGKVVLGGGLPYQVAGRCQNAQLLLAVDTANGTPTVLTSDGGAAGTSNQVILPNDSTYAFRALVVARRTDADNESAAYELLGCIDRNGSAATTALVGSVTKTVIAEDTAAWDVAATADTTNGGLAITVTGEAAKTIRWVCTVWTSEVTG